MESIIKENGCDYLEKKYTTLTIAQHGSSPPVPHRNIIQSPVVKIVHISCNFHHPQILPRQIVDSNLLTQNPSKGVISNKKTLHFSPILHTQICFSPTFTSSTLFPKTKKSPSIFFSGSVRHWKAFESFLKALDKTSLHETTPWLPQHTNEAFVAKNKTTQLK